MTPDKDQAPALIQQAADEAREWLVRKGGYYYRHGFCGYTTRPSEAGRYTRSEAEAEAAVEPDNMRALHQDEVPGANPVAAEVTNATQLAAAEKKLAMIVPILTEIIETYGVMEDGNGDPCPTVMKARTALRILTKESTK